MNYSEEQELEVEALQSIFNHDEELEILNDSYPNRELRLNLLPFPDNDEENHVSIAIQIHYGETYPETLPLQLELINTNKSSSGKVLGNLKGPKGLPNDDKVSKLQEIIDNTAEENIGMPSIYMIAEAVQDFLRENNIKELTMHEEMMLREKEKNNGGDGDGDDDDDDEEYDDDELPDSSGKEQEWKGLDQKPLCPESERITSESFLKWQNDFIIEMKSKGMLKEKQLASTMTGKQIFQKQQQEGISEQDKEDKLEAEVEVDETLFDETGDVDIDELEDEED